MRIVNLIENSPGISGCCYEHGLSFYVETEGHKLLMDTGASDCFLHNAERLGIDLRDVDTLILSHGHYDHAGGIMAFSRINPTATLYMQKTAGAAYYAMDPEGPKYIGIDRRIPALPNLVLLEGDQTLDRELTILSGITGRRRWSQSNLRLKRREGDSFLQDSFDHEQALVIRQAGTYYLFSGCAHNGILNVLDKFRGKFGTDPQVVISGFHFMKGEPYTPQETADILETAKELAKMDTRFYTGHCTSHRAFALMKPIMGEKLVELHTGMEITP